MKREYVFITIILLTLLGLLWLEIPLNMVLDYVSLAQVINELLSGIIIRIVILIMLILIVAKLGFKKFNGIGRRPCIKNGWILLVPVIFILMGLIGNWAIFQKTEKTILFLYGISTLLIGLVEEVSLRGLILPLFIKTQIKRANGIYLSLLYTTLLFGLAHCISFIGEPNFFLNTIFQTFFAAALGMFFGVIMIRTGNIAVTALSHGLINFSFGVGVLIKEAPGEAIQNINDGFNISSFLPNILITFIIFIGAFYMIRKIDKNQIVQELAFLKV